MPLRQGYVILYWSQAPRRRQELASLPINLPWSSTGSSAELLCLCPCGVRPRQWGRRTARPPEPPYRPGSLPQYTVPSRISTPAHRADQDLYPSTPCRPGSLHQYTVPTRISTPVHPADQDLYTSTPCRAGSLPQYTVPTRISTPVHRADQDLYTSTPCRAGSLPQLQTPAPAVPPERDRRRSVCAPPQHPPHRASQVPAACP
jgi:hypothetical protein